MARREQDREDLLAEAVALVERLELRVPQSAEPIVLGVRRDGCLSIYFSAELAVHFNTQQELRRAYLDGALIKAERGGLVSMRRERTEQAVELLSRALTPQEQAALLADISRRTRELQAALASGECSVLRQVPEDFPALERAHQWLSLIPDPVTIAARPHAG